MRKFFMLAGMMVVCISALFTARTDARDIYLSREVQTRFSDYYVSDRQNTGSDASGDKCIFRNGELLYCPQGATDYLFLGKPIQTKNYNLIPIHNSCDGTACHLGTASLIIERGERAKAVHVSECFECISQIRVSDRDYRRDKVNFDLGLLDGARITATFHAGKLSVYRVLDPQELSFNEADCEFLSAAIESCEAPNSLGALPTTSMAGSYAVFSNRHPGRDASCTDLHPLLKFCKKRTK
ncbi:hypothetical protein ACVWZ4_003804 [Bradyrhizobium sp. USDA 4472]